MSGNGNNHRPMVDSVRTRRRRRRHWEAEGQRSFLRSLALAGALGWLIVVPALLGIALGRWIDGRLDSGIQATAALLALGVALGCRLAWKRMHEE